MKRSIFYLPAILFTLTILSCKKKDCEYKDQYVYEPLVYSESCNCIVKGKVKFLEDCKTVALLDYGNGECDSLATKTICKNGKCEKSAGAYTVQVKLDCTQESSQETSKQNPEVTDK